MLKLLSIFLLWSTPQTFFAIFLKILKFFNISLKQPVLYLIHSLNTYQGTFLWPCPLDWMYSDFWRYLGRQKFKNLLPSIWGQFYLRLVKKINSMEKILNNYQDFLTEEKQMKLFCNAEEIKTLKYWWRRILKFLFHYRNIVKKLNLYVSEGMETTGYPSMLFLTRSEHES